MKNVRMLNTPHSFQAMKPCLPQKVREDEKRASNRLSLSFAGIASFHHGGELVRVPIETKDINLSGGYFLAASDLPLEGEIRLSLRWPSEGNEIEMSLTTTGVILRVEPLAEHTYGFATRFEENTSFTEHPSNPTAEDWMTDRGF